MTIGHFKGNIVLGLAKTVGVLLAGSTLICYHLRGAVESETFAFVLCLERIISSAGFRDVEVIG